MAKQWDRKVILLKAEGTEGTDAAPTSAANALKVRNYAPTFMDADFKQRNFEKRFLGANPVVAAAIKRGATFELEIAGGGLAAGTTVPPWMIVNQFAGFNAGVVGASSVVQSPISTAPTATHWAYLDDFLLKSTGCRASMGFVFEDDDFPYFTYTLLGIAPTALAIDSTPTDPTITGFTTPVLAATENTTFSLDGFALPLRRWEMNSNADLQFRSLIGASDRVMLRQRSWSGTVTAELPNMATKDYFQRIRPGTTMVASLVHGTAAGNIVKVDCPALQITGNVTLSDEQGQIMMAMPVTALPNAAAGNDEVVFTSS